MGLSAFPSDNLSMGETSMADSLAINPVQFRPAGGGAAATTHQSVFNSSGDRQDRFWNTMGIDQNGVAREALGLGLGMAMGGMPLAGMGALSMPMAIPLGMGILQQNHHQQHGHTVNYGDKRELWSMLEGSGGAVVGVESLAVRNEHSGFFSTSLAAPPPQSACVAAAQQKVVKSETEGAQMVPVPPQDSADRWDFDHHGEIHQNTQQQQLQIAAVAAAEDQNADPHDQSCGQQQQSNVEDSEGQSIEERWNTWDEEKQQAKEASSKDDQENGNGNENENENEVVYFYRECQRNMAAEKGCTVLDGCGEFMPLAEEEGGKPNPNAAFLCSACSCHRNFHRRVLCDKDGFKVEKKGQEDSLRATHDCITSIKSVVNEVTLSLNQAMSAIHQDSSLFQHSTPNQIEQSFNPAVFLNNLDCLRRAAKSLLVTADCLTTLESVNMHKNLGTTTKDGGNSDSSSSLLNQFKINGSGRHLLAGVSSNGLPLQLSENNNAFSERKEKRKRTRFSTEQITKLNDFAMEVGWTLAGLSKEDIDAVCENVGIEPTTLKYWLYNTRQKSKKRLQEDEMSQSVS